MTDIWRFNVDDYRYRTDNKYFPNTEEGWKEFILKIYFSGMYGYMLFFHYDKLEKEAKTNEI